MTEVWKSNPRHHCDFCKCWIADNKPSRDFHEKGKKHQENVKKKISELQKKGREDDKKKAEMSSYLREMEEGALRAVKKDLKRDPSLASQYGLQQKLNKQKAGDESRNKGEPANSSGTSNSGTSKGEWQMAFSPEGYPYYWNNVSGEVTWTKPEGYKMPTCPQDYKKATPEVQEETEDDELIPINEAEAESDSEKEEASAEPEVPGLEEATLPPSTKADAPPPIEMPSLDNIPLPCSIPLPTQPKTQSTVQPEPEEQQVPERAVKRSAPSSKAYGGWSTVEKDEEPAVDFQLPVQQYEEAAPMPTFSDPGPKIKFREKKVDTLGKDIIAFKKRKLANLNLKKREES